MASGKRRKPKRTTDEYLASALRLSGLVPKLKKYKKRKTLKPAEKSAISRRERQLKNIPFLYPVTKKQAKKLKNKLFLPGIHAIQLRYVPEGSTIKIRGSDISIIEPTGRQWVYWSLDKATVRSKRGMRQAGADAFAKLFPIDIVAQLAERAFTQMDVKEVRLWAHAGIVGDAFEDLAVFIRWVNEKWNQGRYMGETDSGLSSPSDPGRWVNGIAILLEDQTYSKRRAQLARGKK